MGGQVGTVERKVAWLGTRAHGVVCRSELLSAGVTRDEIDGRVRKGALIVVHRGVYLVGHRAPSVEARYLAAVRACGDGAVLCGRAAAYLWGLARGPAPDPEVTAPGGRRVKGVITRRSRGMNPREQTVWRGIPITTPAKTLVALAAAVRETELARACHEAAVCHHTTPQQVEAVLARRPNTPGASRLRRVLRGHVHVTLSKLERRFLERLQHSGLPLPETNSEAGSPRRLPLAGAKPDRRARQLPLPPLPPRMGTRSPSRTRSHARGDKVRRYTYGDVYESPEPMMAELRALLRPT